MERYRRVVENDWERKGPGNLKSWGGGVVHQLFDKRQDVDVMRSRMSRCRVQASSDSVAGRIICQARYPEPPPVPSSV